MNQEFFQDACKRADASFSSLIESEMDSLATRLKNVFSLSKKYTKILAQELLVNDSE